MRKFIHFFLLVVSCLLIAGAVVLSIIILHSGIELYWELGPVVVLAVGVNMIIKILASMKTAKQIDLASTVTNDCCETLESDKATSKVSKEMAEFSDYADALYLENVMNSLLKRGDEKLTKDEKKMWALIQKDVPFDDPLKIQLKKKFYTCEFEDLNQPIC